MAKTHPPYAPEFRRQMVELIRSGRSAGELPGHRPARPQANSAGIGGTPDHDTTSHPVAGATCAAGFSNLVATDSCTVSSAGTSSSTRQVANARPKAIDTAIGIRNCA